ncbi:hypothetical protein PANT_9d00165 [Moesziomyces antarcticus T-34]|uniref:Uncharacterized protein n=1 Tax=Pseudozyma antarctica (strain T-34) TaxID=1151754 RepID=M9MCJ3_PSEA3|nr:hypothetical protein PANT_9d00165 [Moesziomyces antarcticus T-34]
MSQSQPINPDAGSSATLDTRSRANTGASLSAAPLGTSYRSTTGSSVVSNGSLLDLYARSPGSFPSSAETPSHISASSTIGNASIPMQTSASTSSSNGIPAVSATRGFQAPGNDAVPASTGFSMVPSDSNASIWTTASASATESLPHSKRASVAGFDVDVMRSVQPALNADTLDAARTNDLPMPPRIGVEAPQDDSDGSHYDDEEVLNTSTHDSFDRSADRTIEPPHTSHPATAADDEEEVFSNALPSPPVPRRTSSVAQDAFTISPSPSQTENLNQQDGTLYRHTASRSRSGSGQLGSSQIPQRRSSADHRDDSLHQLLQSDDTGPTPPTQEASSSSNAPRDTSSPTKRNLLGAVNEHTRLSTDGSRSSHEPTEDEQRRLEKELLAEADDSRPRTLKEARERAKMRRQQSDTVSPLAGGPTSGSTTTSPRKGASLHVRDVASSVVGGAIDEEVARSSIDSRDRPVRNPKRLSNRDRTAAADQRSLSERSAPSDYSHDSDGEGAFSFDPPPQAAGNTTASAGLPTQGSGMDDLTAAAGVRSSPLASPAKHAPPTPRTPQTPSGSSYFPAANSAQSLSMAPLSSPVRQRATPTTPTTAARPVAPALPSRIEVYGKTLPMPAAFASSNIVVGQKRGSSWDRARAYAQCTNELLHLQTGLALWMQVVQRPAMRQQARTGQSQPDWLAQGTLPRSTHVRNEGSYADSVRSDMTFPMRGDGAKAKELVSVMPTMAESPVQTPVNLPYPGVAPQQTRSNSTQSFASLPGSTSVGEGMGAMRTSGSGAGNRFFSGLGRKNSKRQASVPPPAAVPASSPLASAATGTGGSRAYLANSRNRQAQASPIVSGATSSANPSTDTFETTFSRPESPARAGLGMRGVEAEPSARLDSVREGASAPSGPRPLGPRAPTGSTRLSYEMSRTNSGQAVTSPITPITPITPIAGGFGSGPTFVSRLSGGPSSHEGYTSDLLSAPRRSSQAGSTSPSLSAETSPRIGAGLRSSLSYGSVRDRMRRGSNSGDSETFNATLTKLADILPDADTETLALYLRKAKGNDLQAIGDYLQDQSLGKLPK